MIVQFSGEDRKDAIVNHFSLDIVEEEQFMAYIEEMGYSIDDEDDIIEHLCQMWREHQP
jgi:hypothetical protein